MSRGPLLPIDALVGTWSDQDDDDGASRYKLSISEAPGRLDITRLKMGKKQYGHGTLHVHGDQIYWGRTREVRLAGSCSG